MEVARGHVSDRPFGRTIYTIGVKRFTGDLLLEQKGKKYKVSWENGYAVAAESPDPTDQLARIAMKAGFLDTSSVTEVVRQVAAQPGSDPLAIITEVGGLKPADVQRLKHHALAARCMRTFALADATFVLDNARSLRADPDVPPIDPRWLIYNGVKTHYSAERLKSELAQVGNHAMQLHDHAEQHLPAFGFGEAEKDLLVRLKTPNTLLDIPTLSAQLDTRACESVLYALVSCDLVTAVEAQRAQRQPTVPVDLPAEAPKPAAAEKPASNWRRTQTKDAAPPADAAHGTPAPEIVKPAPEKRARPKVSGGLKLKKRKGSVLTPEQVRALILEKSALIDGKADHFQMLGVETTAKANVIQTEYFSLARMLHPDRLQAIGVDDVHEMAQRVFSRINEAFACLSDTKKRNEYRQLLKSGLHEESGKDAEELAAKLFAAEDHFRKGEMALRRNHLAGALENFKKALELNPDEPEHLALWAWANWCAATDKEAVYPKVQKQMRVALEMSKKCAPAYYYSAKIAAARGDTDGAIDHLKKLLSFRPKHHEARTDLRLLESRANQPDKDKKKGLFRRS